MSSFKKLFFLGTSFLAAALAFHAPAMAQACVNSCNLTGAVNDYWQGNAGAAAGATSITVGARRSGTGTAGNTIAVNDWVIVIQMQDASFQSSNNTNFGGNDGSGAGYLQARQTGLYEFAQAASAVGAGGGVLTLRQPLVNSYNVTAAGSQTTPRFQVVRIPHCVAATLSGTLTGAPWNGRTGGVIALRAETLAMGGATINADAIGFRGGATDAHNGPDNTNAYQGTGVTDQFKGEGIVGTPNYVYDAESAAEINTGLVFPGGYRGRGAPGNAGGGGEGDSGGGGGGNGGNGGRGGVWASGTTGNGAGGRGGVDFAERAATRVVMGGGGAGGSAGADGGYADDSTQELNPPFGTGGRAFSRGGAGGGIVILGAVTRTGSLTIEADGANAPFTNTANNGAQVGGGGGAGGSIVLYGAGGTITANARGGVGAAAPRDGHIANGGGGGGGVVYVSGAFTGVTRVVTGGNAGCTPGDNDTSAGANCNNTNANTSTAGGAGISEVFAATAGPGAPACNPVNLSVVKTDNLTSVTAGQTITYTIQVVNSGPSAAPGTVVTDPGPDGLNCTQIAFSSEPAGAVSSPPGLSVSALQSTGLTFTPTFNANSTATLTLTCGVTATGQTP